MDYRNILLNGFMGCGKSSIGKILSKSLHLKHISLDDFIIENTDFYSINDIFKEKGEEYFRNIETSLLEKILTDSNQLISLGGGTLTTKQSQNLIGSDDLIILLDTPFEECKKRIQNDDKEIRPLFSNIEKARQLYHERLPIYKKTSHLIINCESKTPVDICNEIVDKLK